MKVRIGGEVIGVKEVHNWGYLPSIDLDDGTEYEVAETREDAEEKAGEYWEDMANNDPKEFICIMGEERILAWGMGQSDSYGCHNFQDFVELSSHYPEETFGGYDGGEVDIEIDAELAEELDFDFTNAVLDEVKEEELENNENATEDTYDEFNEKFGWLTIVGYRRN